MQDYIPRKLNAKAMILLWEADTVVVVVICFLLLAMMGSVLAALFVSYFAAKAWVRLKDGGGDGLLTRMVYWFLMPALLVRKEELRSDAREFIG